MKSTVARIILCAVLAALAVTMAAFTFAGFTGDRRHTRQSLYVLGEENGNVAIYGGNDRKHPLAVTEIELAGLREADRKLLADGLPVKSREELAQILEDLGS